jgi:hypothetical protein
VYLPGALIAPPAEIVDPLDDPLAGSFSDAPLPVVEHARIPDVELAIEPAAPTNGSDASSRNGLPKRSPGASGVNGVAVPVAAAEQTPARESTTNSFSYFTSRSMPEASPSQSTPAAEPVRPNIEAETAPIFERMVSEWLMDPTALESRDGAWATAADAGWAAAEQAVEQKPQRHTESGLPVRERGARLVPGRARTGSDPGADVGRDAAAVGDTLSRALAGVRSGRAESSAAHRRIEGDE